MTLAIALKPAEHVHVWTTGARCACGAKRCVRWHCQAARAFDARCLEHAEKAVVLIDAPTAPHVHAYPTGGGRCACGAQRCRAGHCPEPRTIGHTCAGHASERARQREADRLLRLEIPQGRPVRALTFSWPAARRQHPLHLCDRGGNP